MPELYLDDIDVADYGAVLSEETRGHASSPSLSDVAVPVGEWPGIRWSGEPTVTTQRTLTVGLNVSATSNANLVAALDKLKALATDGTKRLRFADRTDQEYRGASCREFRVTPRGALFGVGANVSLDFSLDDPARHRVNPDGYALSAARTPCPTGTAPSRLVLLLHGGGASLTNPVATLRNAAGKPVQTMGFTVSLGANDFLRIDSERATITKVASGTASDGLAAGYWTSGDFLLLRPTDGWFEAAAWPSIALSASSGTPAGFVTYTRRYL